MDLPNADDGPSPTAAKPQTVDGTLTQLGQELEALEARIMMLRRTESKLDKDRAASFADLLSQQKRAKQAMEQACEQNGTPEQAAAARDLVNRVDALRSWFPRPARPMLKLSLGSADVSMAHKDRFKYKAEYESFKLRITVVQLLLGCLSLYFIDYTVVYTLLNFLILYYYCTISLREHILIVNGSNIRVWWLVHHYLSAGLSGVLLVWPLLSSYRELREQFIMFQIYLSAVQLLQFRYQMHRLYTLRSLGKRGILDVTTDAAPTALRAISILLPFLLGGHVFQLYNGITCFFYLFRPDGHVDYFSLGAAGLFIVTGAGNMLTTLGIYRKKVQRMNFALNLKRAAKK